MSYLESIARSVVRYNAADREALRAFQRVHFGARSRHCDDTFFEWLFERNPHRDPRGPSLWLCKRDGVVVGQQASIPFTLKVDDSEHRAAWNIDLMVHPDWRLKGVAPALFAAFRESTEILLGLGVEDPVYPAFRRAGWQDIDTMSLYVRPLDPQACAKGLSAPKWTRAAPRVLFSSSARLMGGFARTLTRAQLEPIAAFDDRVDAIWAAASRDYPILAKRDFPSLRWRYDEGPHRVLYERYYLRHCNDVVGYAVVRLEKWHGHVIARVVDYLTPRRWVSPLLALVIDAMSTRPVVAVFIEQVHAGMRSVLLPLGCVRARPSCRFMFNLPRPQPALSTTLGRSDRWFVMPGDGDMEHIWIALEDALTAQPASPAPQPISASRPRG